MFCMCSSSSTTTVGVCCISGSPAIRSFRITPSPTAYRSPWRTPVAERWIGSARREMSDAVCTDHVHADRVESRERRTYAGCSASTSPIISPIVGACPWERNFPRGIPVGETLARCQIGGPATGGRPASSVRVARSGLTAGSPTADQPWAFSPRAPDSSTPVGPAPTTTKVSHSRRRSGASSRSAASYASSTRRWISRASSTVFRPRGVARPLGVAEVVV